MAQKSEFRLCQSPEVDGFDLLASSLLPYQTNPYWQQAPAANCLDHLLRFAEAIGAVPLDNPEHHHYGQWLMEYYITYHPETERLTTIYEEKYEEAAAKLGMDINPL